MSSPDLSTRPAGGFRLGAFVAVLGLAVLLAACNVRPMYGSLSTGARLSDTLSTIAVDPIPERLGQQVRNEIVYAMSGAVEPVSPRYRLTVTVVRSSSSVGIHQISGTPTAEVLTVSADYRLVDAGTGEELTKGKSFADASFDFSNQRYANLRAERDAEDRAAVTIANDIVTKVAAFLARTQ